MSMKENLRWLCCTFDGIQKMQKVVAFVVGGLVIATAILTMLGNIALPLTVIRCIWNLVFGVIIIFVQLNWKKMIARNFGFLKHWCMRGMFYIFVGSNCMNTSGQFLQDAFSFIVGGLCVFVGVLELIIGCRAGERMEFEDEKEAGGDVESGGSSKIRFGFGKKKDKGNAVEPTLNCGNVTVTPAQAAQASNWAAAGGGGGGYSAPTPSAPAASGGAAANPFFGNAHLNN